MRMLSWTLAAAMAVGLAGAATAPARAADVTLKAISFDRHDSTYTRPLLDMADIVNKANAGLRMQIVPDGTMSPFAMGNAVKNGVVDVAGLPFTFYQNLLPIGDAMKLATKPRAELAKNGTFALLEALHEQKVNAHVLDVWGDGMEFYLYLRDKKITTPDLTGLKLRITPIYRAAFKALGADVVQMPPSDVYTALQRGVVDGYGWTILDLPALGWAKYTKYRVEPSFFQVWEAFLINLDTWKKLSPGQQKVLTDAAVKAGQMFKDREPELIARSIKEQKDLGIEPIVFKGTAARKFLDTAYEASWAEAMRIDPTNAKKLRQLISQ